MKVGDYVTRISYKHDILFQITEIKDEVLLKGVYERIIADSPADDLVEAKDDGKKITEYRNKIIENNSKQKRYLSGKILHLDGDREYLNQCLELYQKVGAYVNGVHLQEKLMSSQIISYIELYNPDIVVITGHDSYNRKGLKSVDNYLNSSFFADTIYQIRKRYSKDDIVVIAGACQSHFEALIAAGANFATSPKRVNVHLFDPAITAIKVSFTPFNRIVSIKDIYRFSYIKKEGLGGIESYGKMRLLL